MKLVSSVAIAVSIALGSVALSASPALAAKEKAPKAPKAVPPKLSKEFQAAYAKADAAMKANNVEEAKAGIAAASAIATTPDDKYFAGQIKLNLAQKINDRNMLRAALIDMVASQSPVMTNAPVLNLNAGLLAYEQKDYQDTIAKVLAAEQGGGATPDGLMFASDSYFRLKQPQAGLAYGKKAIDMIEASGKKADQSWYLRPRGAAYQAGLVKEGGEWSRKLVSAFPNKENWHDAVALHLNASKPQDEARADMFRLMREMGVMISRDEYRELAELLQRLQAPAEAKAVINEGVSRSLLKANDQAVGPLVSAIDGMLPADKASLTNGYKSAQAAERGSITARWAGAFMGHGDNTKAAELYRVALQKGQVDADAINFRLGLVLSRLGQKDAAIASFESAKGNYEVLGKLAAQYLRTGIVAAPAA